MRTSNRLIGAAIERVEDLRFLRGRGEYVDDVARPDQLHAVIFRSPIAHGRIRGIDTRAARAIPGVHSIVTAADLPKPMPTIDIRLQPMPQLVPFQQPVLAYDKVRYVGEPLALILADSVGIAEDAAGAIDFEIEELTAIVDRWASGEGNVLLHEFHGSNSPVSYRAAIGNVQAAFKNAPYARREHFRVHRHAATPMEPRGLFADWDEGSGKLTVRGGAKVLFFNRRMLAEKMALPEDKVDYIENDVGGGFGARGEFYPEDFLIPFAARRTGRPIKWTEDRRESLLAMQHARDSDGEIEIACEKDGTILAIRGHGFTDVGAYIRTNGLVAPRNIAQFIAGPYRIPNVEYEMTVQFTNKTPSGTYRGPGRFEGDFFRERLLDMVAKDLGIDRVEFRRKNLVSKAEIPYPVPDIAPYPQVTHLDSGDYARTLDKCLAEFDWTEKVKLSGKLIDGRYHGIALGCYIEGGAAGPKENAKFVIEKDGTISIYVGSSAIGQGLETVFGQIAADAMELPFESVRIYHGSTTYLKEGYGSYHSRAVVMGGSAMLDCAVTMREAMRAAAAKRLDCQPSDITIADDTLTAPGGRSLNLADLAGLSAEGSFSNHHHTYSYGTAAAHVAVDPGTGRVQVLDYVIASDVGRIMNPLTLRGQIVGGTVQGLGGALLEEFHYDASGQALATSFADYLMPLASDFPVVRVFLSEDEPSPINPLGAKGAGEGGIIPCAALLGNAVAAALSSLGAEPHEVPLSPTRVWRLIQDAKK